MDQITARQRALFEEQGFLQVPGVLDADQCDALARYAWSLMPPGFDGNDPGARRGRIQDCCNNIPLYQRKGLVRFKADDGFRSHPAIVEAIYENSRLRAMFRDLCDHEVEHVRVRGLNPNLPFPRQVSINTLLGNRLNDEVDGGVWDSITLPSPPQFPIPGHLEAHAMELGAFIYLTDVGRDAGGLAVWPGSHRLFKLAFDSPIDFLPNEFYGRFNRMLQKRRPVVLEGRAGDVILFHNRLLHGNTYNRSRTVRHLAVVDVLGAGWRERAGINPVEEIEVERLRAAKSLKTAEPAVSVLNRLDRDPTAAFLHKHPRLNRSIQAISKDPVAAGRNDLSMKIRSRREHDVWVVVSQGDEHRRSYKLDAYGSAKKGRYAVKLDDGAVGRSRCGMLVERIEPASGSHVVRLNGWFSVPHHLRIIRTANPFSRSDILAVAEIPAGARRFEVAFDS